MANRDEILGYLDECTDDDFSDIDNSDDDVDFVVESEHGSESEQEASSSSDDGLGDDYNDLLYGKKFNNQMG